MKRRTFCTLAAIPLILGAHAAARAQEQFLPGRHFLDVSPRQPTKDARHVEVLEFFAYSCSHCNAFEPAIDAWQKKLPRDVLFRRIPVAFREDLVIHQELYFAIEAMGLVEQLHPKVFHAMHGERQKLASAAEIAAFAAKHGTDGKRLVDTMASFGITAKVKQATALARGYDIEGTPSLGIDGRWLTSGSMAGTNERSLLVAEHLVASAKKAR
ncbi:MAG: hypothetical protein A3E23_09670 [Burkholderiales bacterium RIFCSPHIGHO2_12_FULL_65_48]|nr:MAG: hypothetical protein A3E23_09670 [Burkholderiales bacterium RIFCSPHIGHO2_12_FULL_65_48]